MFLLIVRGQLCDGILEVDVVVHVVDGGLVELGQQIGALLELHCGVASRHLLARGGAPLHLREAFGRFARQRVHLAQ